MYTNITFCLPPNFCAQKVSCVDQAALPFVNPVHCIMTFICMDCWYVSKKLRRSFCTTVKISPQRTAEAHTEADIHITSPKIDKSC